MQLSDFACRNAKPQPRIYKLFDGGGLYLEVMPKGSKNWRLKYRYLGKEKRISFGSYPQVSLLKAREEREAAKKELKNGNDPSALRQQELRLAKYNAQQTFELIAREWHKEYYDRWSEGHAKDILRRLEADVFTQIGRMPISQVTAPVIYSCVKKIEDRGAQELARRALQMIGQVFRYATITGRAQRDLTIEIRGALKKQNKGHYASIKVGQLPDLVKALNANEARLYRQTILSIKLLMLTFVRTRELIEAPWSEFDLEKSVWNIPAERMKMRNPHIVPLSRQAVEMLKELQGINGKRKYILPSISKPNKPMSNNTILKALERMGYGGEMTGHGFRSLAMSAIKEKLNYRHEVIDRQLAHLPRNKVDRAYDRAEFLEERTKMMQDWADYIDSLS